MVYLEQCAKFQTNPGVKPYYKKGDFDPLFVPPRRVHADSLISPRILVQFLSRHSPFAQCHGPHATRERHVGPIRGKWASLAPLTGGMSACRTAKSGDRILNKVFGTLLFSQKGRLKFLFPKAMIQAYGVWKEKSMYGRKYLGIERTTVLIAKDGTISHVFPKVKVDGHYEEVLEALS